MLKKIMTLMSSVGIAAIASTSVVSCVAPGYANGDDGQRVVVSTDGGKISDHSFNEDAYDGVAKFLKQAFDIDSADHSYVEARDSDISSIVSGYKLSKLKGANAVVLPGFSHMNALNTLGPDLGFLSDTPIVLVDGVNKASNVVSLQFNSQISGVLAGFDTAYWATTRDGKGHMQGDMSGDGKITLGTFAGASNKYGVDNYMWGLELGMQIFNEWITNTPGYDSATGVNKSLNNRPIVYSGNVGGQSGIGDGPNLVENVSVSTTTDNNYFTNSFALGGATSSGILNRLINKNRSDVIFPVAGPQIEDVINFSGDFKPKLIGIDVNQAATYTAAAREGRFITSAIKNIDTAVPEALYRIQAEDEHHNITKKNTLNIDSKTMEKENPKTDDKPNGDAWLGKQPDPFVNWSIDYNNDNLGLGADSPYRYQLDHNWLELYDPSNVLTSAPEFTPMWAINTYFAQLGQTSPEYMQGANIKALADWLWKTYSGDKQSGKWTEAILSGKDGQGKTGAGEGQNWLSWASANDYKGQKVSKVLIPKNNKGTENQEFDGNDPSVPSWNM